MAGLGCSISGVAVGAVNDQNHEYGLGAMTKTMSLNWVSYNNFTIEMIWLGNFAILVLNIFDSVLIDHNSC